MAAVGKTTHNQKRPSLHHACRLGLPEIMKTQKQNSRVVSILMLGLLCHAVSLSGLAAEAPDRLLTTAAEVRGLSAAEAYQHHPVKLRGVVTFYDEALYSRFVQDETAGIYLQELATMPALLPGQVVEVEGVTGPGEYAPVILPTSVKVVGAGKLPVAKPVTLEELVGGHDDSQMVEFSGIVRAVRFDKESQYFMIDFAKGGERFTAYTKQLPDGAGASLVDSTMKVRGVSSTMFNHQRQLFGVRLLVPKAEGLVVEKPAPANAFEMAANKINSLLQFTPGGTLGERVKVAGTVACGEPGSAIFIQDQAAGLFCQTRQLDSVQPGDQVEILGYPAKGEYTPILEDAVFRKIGAGVEPKADAVDVNEILTGVHDCRLVQLSATVLDRVQRGVNQFFLLQSSDFTFQAYLPQKGNNDELAAIPNGSEVMVTGICMIERGSQWQAGDKWRAASFHLLLRSPKDVSVLNQSAAGKMPDTLWIAVVAGFIAVGSLLWVVAVRIKHREPKKS